MTRLIQMNPLSKMHEDYNLLAITLFRKLHDNGFHVPDCMDLESLKTLRKAIKYKYGIENGEKFEETYDESRIRRFNDCIVPEYAKAMEYVDLTQGVYHMYTHSFPTEISVIDGVMTRSFNPNGYGAPQDIYTVKVGYKQSVLRELEDVSLYAKDKKCIFSAKHSCAQIANIIADDLLQISRENRNQNQNAC